MNEWMDELAGVVQHLALHSVKVCFAVRATASLCSGSSVYSEVPVLDEVCISSPATRVSLLLLLLQVMVVTRGWGLLCCSTC
jgi:hypothetical protein